MSEFLNPLLNDCLQSLPQDHPLRFLVAHLDNVSRDGDLDEVWLMGSIVFSQFRTTVESYKQKAQKQKVAEEHATILSEIATLYDNGHKSAAKFMIEHHDIDPDCPLVREGLEQLADVRTRNVIEKHARKLLAEQGF